ncbi:MAG: hypothetical protein WD276_04920 [Actinomycetota bacterium]
MLIRIREERGIALITVLLVLMVFVSLSLAAVQLVAHNAESSAFQRKRDQALQASEAGLDSYIQHLRTATGTAVCPSTAAVELSQTPTVEYTVDVAIYDVTGAKIGCTNPAYTGTPRAETAVVSVTGSVGTAANTTQVATRKLQARLVLNPVNSIDKAIVGNNHLIIQGNVNILRNQLFPDADLYTNGDLDISASGMHIEGSVYSQGDVDLSGCVDGDVWADGYVHMSSANVGIVPCTPSGAGYAGWGEIISSTGDIDMSASWANGICTMGTTYSANGSTRCNAFGGGPYTAAPDVVENSPQGPPPSYSFPELDAATVISDLQAEGYELNTYSDCATASAAIAAAPVGNKIFRISPACALSFGNGTAVAMRGNYAIVMDGSFATINNSDWTTSAGSCSNDAVLYPDNQCTLHIIRPYDGALNCGSQPVATSFAPGTYGIATSNNTDLTGINFFVYTQCDATFQNQGSDGQGQIIAGWVQVTNNFDLSFYPIFVPGLTSGFASSVSYVREI